MKILFICANIEPGKDGVGDYTRKLAGALQKRGIAINIVALNDRYIKDDYLTETQEDEGIMLNVLRFAKLYPWKQKIQKINSLINKVQPDWVSLQYVPYGFNKKGLPFFLTSVLKKIKGDFKWHIMFHEMWIGISDFSPLMHKFYGFFQKAIASSLVNTLHPSLITTTNKLYQLVMQEKNISAKLLTLFSNIPVFEPVNDYLNTLEKQYKLTFKSKSTFFLGIFGTLYPSANLDMHIPKFINSLKQYSKVVVIFLGRNTHPGELLKIRNRLSDSVQVIELNELRPWEISSIFSVLNKAILCTPKEHTGKSGAYAALCFHNVDVLIPSSQPIPKHEKTIEVYNSLLSERPSSEWGVDYISDQFIRLLNND